MIDFTPPSEVAGLEEVEITSGPDFMAAKIAMIDRINGRGAASGAPEYSTDEIYVTQLANYRFIARVRVQWAFSDFEMYTIELVWMREEGLLGGGSYAQDVE